MPTCTDVIGVALRRLRQVRSGEQATGQEAVDAMLVLQSMYDTWVADGLFGRLNDVIVSAAYTAFEQDRVINDSALVVTLPLTVQPSRVPVSTYPYLPDQYSWQVLSTAVARPPRDLAMVENILPTGVVRWVYNAHLRAWIKMNALAITDVAPLSERGLTGLASCLATKLADEYGAQPLPGTSREATLFQWGLSARPDSQRVAAMQDYF